MADCEADMTYTSSCDILADISNRIVKIVDDHFETVRDDHIDIVRIASFRN